jgi:hypothetical protein
MNKQDFLEKHMVENGNDYEVKFAKGFRIDKRVAAGMDEGHFKEVLFFELRKLRQQFVQDIDRLSKKIVKGGFG